MGYEAGLGSQCSGVEVAVAAPGILLHHCHLLQEQSRGTVGKYIAAVMASPLPLPGASEEEGQMWLVV